LLENITSDTQNPENSIKITTTTEISNRKNECPRCGKAFYNKKALTDHLNRKFPCDDLDLHFLSADSICNPTTCFRCNREFSSAKRLENHISVVFRGRRMRIWINFDQLLAFFYITV
jgi:DNA-directed RNA polymerase subunit RPC12/RpoP